jgi:hypothetical protein
MPEVWGWDCGMEAGWFARSLMTRTRQLTLRCPKRWPVQWRDEQMCDAPIRPILTTRILHHQSWLTPPTLEFGHHPRETCSCSRPAMNSVFVANLALFCPSMKSLNLKAVWKDLGMVEPTGIEPATFSLRTRRSTN